MLMEEKQATVDAVAGRCGFLSLASFTQAFKRLYGMTPGQYRKRTRA